MRRWDVSGDGKAWKVDLDVRDLSGHLDLTLQARAGTLSKRVKDPTHGVAAVGALSPLGSRSKLGLVRGSICLLVFMLLKLRMFLFLLWPLFVQPLVGLLGPAKMPMASTSAILILLDGLSGVDNALYVILGQVKHDA